MIFFMFIYVIYIYIIYIYAYVYYKSPAARNGYSIVYYIAQTYLCIIHFHELKRKALRWKVVAPAEVGSLQNLQRCFQRWNTLKEATVIKWTMQLWCHVCASFAVFVRRCGQRLQACRARGSWHEALSGEASPWQDDRFRSASSEGHWVLKAEVCPSCFQRWLPWLHIWRLPRILRFEELGDLAVICHLLSSAWGHDQW